MYICMYRQCDSVQKHAPCTVLLCQVLRRVCQHGASLVIVRVKLADTEAGRLTVQPVASDKLAILTKGVLPINPAKPLALAEHRGLHPAMSGMPNACSK